jgi:hypothetical protein
MVPPNPHMPTVKKPVNSAERFGGGLLSCIGGF